MEDGELLLELLPELQEFTPSRDDNNGDAFTSFINAPQKVGRVVILRPQFKPTLFRATLRGLCIISAKCEDKNTFDTGVRLPHANQTVYISLRLSLTPPNFLPSS